MSNWIGRIGKDVIVSLIVAAILGLGGMAVRQVVMAETTPTKAKGSPPSPVKKSAATSCTPRR